MKKTTLFLALVLGSVILLSSCSTTYKMNLGDASADQGATVNFSSGFMVKKWNNIDIYDDLYGDWQVWWESNKTRLTVPSGNNSFTFDVNFSINRGNSITTYKYNNIELQYNLLPGRKYSIETSAKMRSFLGTGVQLSIGIYDVTNGKELLKEWKLRDDS
ncbi:MAG: hypothetical protein LBI28_11340 [Treponema sp.]|jgi:hypothetical protein|nr:hypothetical protein [Treponema sp.]